MNMNHPEIRTQVLEWQRRHSIRDDDPAMALLELLDLYYRPQATSDSISPEQSAEAVTQSVKFALTPLLERLSQQLQTEVQSAPSPDMIASSVKSSITPLLERLSQQLQTEARSALSPDAMTSTIRSSMAPALDRVNVLIQELNNQRSLDVTVPSETISEAIRMALLPAIERVTFQTQELKNKMDSIDLTAFTNQIAAYHDGIDYCTKKLDVVKKESDGLLVRIDRATASIKPVTKGAIAFLMALSGVVGYVLGVILR